MSRDNTTTRSVYVTTENCQIGEIVVDGDVEVVTIDWDEFHDHDEDDEDDEGGDDLARLLERLGVDSDELPAGLAAALRKRLKSEGVKVPSLRPVTGPDRPWALIGFGSDTFTADDVDAAPGVTVVYHDWSLWNADLGYTDCGPQDVDALRAEADTLGPDGRRFALGLIADYEARTAAQVC